MGNNSKKITLNSFEELKKQMIIIEGSEGIIQRFNENNIDIEEQRSGKYMASKKIVKILMINPLNDSNFIYAKPVNAEEWLEDGERVFVKLSVKDNFSGTEDWDIFECSILYTKEQINRFIEKKRKQEEAAAYIRKLELICERAKYGMNYYYMHDYIKQSERIWGISLEENINNSISEEVAIYKYKPGDKHIVFFSEELKFAVLEIIKSNDNYKNFVLMSVPRSSTGMESSIKRSLKYVENLLKKTIPINYFDCLERVEDVEGSVHGSRNIEKHTKSVVCRYPKNEKNLKETLFIVVDDIITSGSTMKAMTEIMKRDSGIQEDDIICLSLARTRGFMATKVNRKTLREHWNIAKLIY